MIMNMKQKKIKIEPWIKLNYNMYSKIQLRKTILLLHCMSSLLELLECAPENVNPKIIFVAIWNYLGKVKIWSVVSLSEDPKRMPHKLA